MATTVVSAAGLAAHGNAIGRASNGRLWTRRLDGTTIRWFTSTDNGASWSAGPTETIPALITGELKAVGGFHIDGNDRLWSVRIGEITGGTTERYRLSRKLDATVSTGSFVDATFATGEVGGNQYVEGLDVVAHDVGSNTVVHIVSRRSTNTIEYRRSSVASNGAGAMDVTPTGATMVNGSTSPTGSNPNWGGEITFRHTGDGKTVAASTPDLWVSWGSGSSMFLRRAAWNGTSWSWQTQRNMGARTTTRPVKIAYDGARVIVVSGNTTSVVVAERDTADTTTTTRTPPALSDGNVESVAATVDPNTGALVVFAQGATSNDPQFSIYNRTANSWGSWSTIETTTLNNPLMSSVEAGVGGFARVVYATTTPTIRHHPVTLNVLPTAPTWLVPSSDRTVDKDSDLTLTWQHNDANSDAQTARKLRRRINGGSWEWWTGSGWGADVGATTASQTITLTGPVGTFADVHEYQVATSDDEGYGSYSASRTLTMGQKVNPTITSPADLATIGTSQVEVEGTVAESSAYRWRIYTPSGVQVFSTGKVGGVLPGSPEVLPFDLDNLTTWKLGLSTWSALDVESDEDVISFDVDYVTGPTPTVAASQVGSAALVQITNPAPGMGDPGFVTQELWARLAPDADRPSLQRPVGGNGVRVAADLFDNSAWTDHLVPWFTPSQYRVRALFDNGTVAWSDWSAVAGTSLTETIVDSVGVADAAAELSTDWTTFDDGVSATPEATVTGLTNGVEYEFHVAAVNSEGQADWSNIAGPYTPGVV